MLKMGACPAHSSVLVSSFVQPVTDDPKRGLPSFLVAYNAVDTLAREQHKNEKAVKVKSSNSIFEFK